jgi:plastocyanin
LRIDRAVSVFSALLIVGGVGCDKPDPPESAGSRVHEAARVVGHGKIRGCVSFSGKPPVMQELANQPCHPGAPKLEEETVVVGAGGGLKNVFVQLEGAPRSAGRDEPVLLDQVNCRYVPHVLGVTVGQPLLVRSSDPTMHNVHLIADLNPSANFGMTGAGQERTLTFANPEMIRVKCDVHPWMAGYVMVCENPFFAVSSDDGSFEISGVPAGSYMLTAWHELYGKLQQPVTIEDDKPVEAKFDYREP